MNLRLQTLARVQSIKQKETSYILMLEERPGQDCTLKHVK